MNEKPEAMRLAEWAEWFCRNVKDPQDFRWKHMAEAAAELRRLHALNTEMLEALRGFVAIAADSEGVAGYHLNGDIEEWAAFPEWHEAHAAIAKAEGVNND